MIFLSFTFVGNQIKWKIWGYEKQGLYNLVFVGSRTCFILSVKTPTTFPVLFLSFFRCISQFVVPYDQKL